MLKTLLVVLLFIFICLNPLSIHAQLQTDSNTVITSVGTPTTGVAPVIEDANLRQALIDKYGITMNGFDTTHLRWTWEKLHEINNPNFTSLLNGSLIQATSGISSQDGCFNGLTSLRMGQYQPELFFKFILIHELSHIIQSCTPREKSKVVEHANAYASEGAISYYAANTQTCTGLTNNANEDYADTLAYYFNSAAGFSSGPNSCIPANLKAPPNPIYTGNAFPLHRAVAESI